MTDIQCYKLSEEAESDISSLYDYTYDNFGLDQTIDYLQGLEQCLETILNNPDIGKQRAEIRDGLRSFLYEKHTIFYRIHSDYIRIVRVINSNRDLPNLL
jgi:toxin ParE1/3/4|tara:strand:+ start:1530 stop:1829 length:300 start_codon:yes stop_codon:yes gene_type:complete